MNRTLHDRSSSIQILSSPGKNGSLTGEGLFLLLEHKTPCHVSSIHTTEGVAAQDLSLLNQHFHYTLHPTLRTSGLTTKASQSDVRPSLQAQSLTRLSRVAEKSHVSMSYWQQYGSIWRSGIRHNLGLKEESTLRLVWRGLSSCFLRFGLLYVCHEV